MLEARWWPSSEPTGSAIVVVPGFTGSKDDDKTGAVAEALTAAGHHVLSYDARGHRGSGGRCTLGDMEWLDVAAAVEHTRDEADHVVVVGASMGAIAVLRYAAAAKDLDGVVAVSSPSHWRRPRNVRTLLAVALTRTRTGRALAARRLGVRISPGWRDPDPPVALVPRIEAPIAIVHGQDDRMIPARDALELARAATAPCRLRVVRGMGHAFDGAAAPAILEGVEWVLDAPVRVAA